MGIGGRLGWVDFFFTYYYIIFSARNLFSPTVFGLFFDPPKFIYVDKFWTPNIIFTKSQLSLVPLKTSQTIWNNPISYRFISLLSMLSPLRKRRLINADDELRMRATGTIFIVDLKFSDIVLDTITNFNHNFKNKPKIESQPVRSP